MTLEQVFSILVLLYTVSNMASIGLELNFRETTKSLSSVRLVVATRNGAPLLAVYTAFPVQDPRMLMMFLLTGPIPALVAFPLARIFASRAGGQNATFSQGGGEP